MDTLHTLFFFLLALLILVAVHEFGHFWVARRMGVKVIRFSLGFGPVLWRRQQPGDTEYVISAIPLGGYVRMVDEREAVVAPEDLPYAFNRQPLAARSAIVLAGPVSNLLLAFFLFWVLLVSGEKGIRPVLGPVAAQSLAANAGLQAGDEILAVAGRETPIWSLALAQIYGHMLDREAIRLDIRTVDGQLASRQLYIPEFVAQSPDLLRERLGLRPFEPALDAVIGMVEKDSAAAQAGLRPGDRIVAVNGQKMADWQAWVAVIRSSPGQSLATTIQRDGMSMDLVIVPATIENGADRQGKVGAAVLIPEHAMDDLQITYRRDILSAGLAAAGRTVDYTWMTLDMMANMLTRRAGVDNLSGPISIAQYAGRSATLGMDQFINFLATISVSLGVLNLLPVPLLDGGHLMFFIAEAVRGGRPVPEAIQMQFQRVGLLVLLSLMALAFYLDIGRLLA